MESIINDEAVKEAIIKELEDFGCCDLCILRYLGATEPYLYRSPEESLKKLRHSVKHDVPTLETPEANGNGSNGLDMKTIQDGDQPSPKLLKRSPCAVCLGLLDSASGTSQHLIDEIVKAVKDANIQSKSYTVNLSLPISVQFRAYYAWFRLIDKFQSVYEQVPNMKPEGICLKNAWKWICTGKLKEKIDPKSEWVTEGCLTVNVSFKYDDDETECAPLSRQFRGTKANSLSRGSIDIFMKDVGVFEFRRKFGDVPPAASSVLKLDSINCSHVALYLAGRYNKLSRNVSQTPWIIDGKRFHDGSVEELIAEHALPMFQAESEKLSASGREDVDVRMLGKGRPFVLEIIGPKRTLFLQSDINKLRDRINESTSLIQVRDLQLFDRKSAGKIKEGEEFKRKNYCALCRMPNGEVTQEIIDKLNAIPVPLVLQQKTPIRVLHRRSLMTRERSIYSIKAVPGRKANNLFKLYVETQAGTYVKELVHGDLGRTKPSIAEILGCEADIVSLDVQDIDFPWPPPIED